MEQGTHPPALPSPHKLGTFKQLGKGETMDIWEFLDQETNNAEGVRELAFFSAINQNVKRGTTFGVFLDLIGWSEEKYGQSLVSNPSGLIGYVEADLLADALKDWSNRPLDVEAWVDKFLAVDSGEVTE